MAPHIPRGFLQLYVGQRTDADPATATVGKWEVLAKNVSRDRSVQGLHLSSQADSRAPEFAGESHVKHDSERARLEM